MSCAVPPPGNAHLERLGLALTGRYQIEREIGSGAHGLGPSGPDLKHDRAVAMKVMHPEVAAKLGPGRFQREIRLAARLQHPHILPVYDSGTSAGLLWFTMPRVEGVNLRQRLRQGALPIAEAIPILWSLARALGYAHRNGVIHRDIKPENILLGRDNVYLADFGVAKPEAMSDPHMTTVGQAIGTPVYMAPEQAEGDPATDHRADIYGFGILAYELFAGSPPFGLLPAALASEEPDPVSTRRPEVPAPLVSLIERCLRKHPGDRWQSADDIRKVLEEALRAGVDAGSVGCSLRPQPGQAAAELTRRRPRTSPRRLLPGRMARGLRRLQLDRPGCRTGRRRPGTPRRSGLVALPRNGLPPGEGTRLPPVHPAGRAAGRCSGCPPPGGGPFPPAGARRRAGMAAPGRTPPRHHSGIVRARLAVPPEARDRARSRRERGGRHRVCRPRARHRPPGERSRS